MNKQELIDELTNEDWMLLSIIFNHGLRSFGFNGEQWFSEKDAQELSRKLNEIDNNIRGWCQNG
ncbi:hypothetical protein ACSSTF_004781 [Escherichia coli]